MRCVCWMRMAAATRKHWRLISEALPVKYFTFGETQRRQVAGLRLI